ncbi:MAG: hypothetical protein ABIW48_07480 [Burkholderiales bacterium]
MAVGAVSWRLELHGPSTAKENLIMLFLRGALVEPVEIARVVAFLAGAEASAITGACIPVDFGWLVTPSWHGYGGLRR